MSSVQKQNKIQYWGEMLLMSVDYSKTKLILSKYFQLLSRFLETTVTLTQKGSRRISIILRYRLQRLIRKGQDGCL